MREQQLFASRKHLKNVNFDLEQAPFTPKKPLATLPTPSNQFLPKKCSKTPDFNLPRKLSHFIFFYTIFLKSSLSFLNFFFPVFLVFSLTFFSRNLFLKQSKNLKIRENVQISQKSTYLSKTSVEGINFIQRLVSTLNFEKKTRSKLKKMNFGFFHLEKIVFG